MNANQSHPENGLYVVVNSGKKRKPNDQRRYNILQKRRPNISNNDGELCIPVSQCSSNSSDMYRNEIPYLNNSQRETFEVISNSGNEVLYHNEMSNNYIDESVSISTSSECQQERVPMCLLPDGTYRPMIVNPDSFTDIVQLREALNSANLTIQELLNREKKLRREKISMKNQMENEVQRASELERILREQNIRIKQIIAENVRWTTRYNRLKLLFGEEDLKVALGELAPEYR